MLHGLVLARPYEAVARRTSRRWCATGARPSSRRRTARSGASPSGSPRCAVLFPGRRSRRALALPERLRALPAPDEDAALARDAARSSRRARSRHAGRAGARQRARADARGARAGASGGRGLRPARPLRRAPRRRRAEYCARRLLARIHAYTRERRRRRRGRSRRRSTCASCSRWQQVRPEARREGRRGVLAAVEQLQGFELAAGAWESAVLPARVAEYKREWLDALCLSGEVAWGRLGLREGGDPARSGSPSRATPIALARRDDLPWLLAALRGGAAPEVPAGRRGERAARAAARARRAVRGRAGVGQRARRGGGRSRRSGTWWRAASSRADGFEPLRLLLGTRRAAAGRAAPGARARLRQRLARAGGRWAPLADADTTLDRDELAEAVAEQLLARWGVVFFDVLARESLALPWRDILWALRRLEARGLVRGGRFVTGFAGEQYALPGAARGAGALAPRAAPRRDAAPLGGRSAEPGRHPHAGPAHPGRCRAAGSSSATASRRKRAPRWEPRRRSRPLRSAQASRELR